MALTSIGSAHAQQGNPPGQGGNPPGQGNPPGNNPPGNGGNPNNPPPGCGQGQGGGNNPNCTYPANDTIIVRDVNGNVVTGTSGLRVGDTMNTVSEGWLPSSEVSFYFFSDPIFLGNVAADGAGTVRASFPVPRVDRGQHTLRLQGLGRDGAPRVVDYPILVVPSSTVLGQTLDNTAALGAGSSRTRVLGKTGLDGVYELVSVGFALMAVGAALVLAVRRSRTSLA